MKSRIGLMAGLCLLAAVFASPQSASALPFYDIKASWGDTNLPPGGEGQFVLQARNVGDEDGKGQLTISDQLPAGVKVTDIAVPSIIFGELADDFSCSGEGSTEVECIIDEFWVSLAGAIKKGLAQAPGTKETNGLVSGGASLAGLQPSGYLPTMFIDIAIDPDASGGGTNTATISGGGAAQPANDVDQVAFDAAPSQFGPVPGSYEADVFDAAYPFGSPLRQAGDHPFEQRVDFDLNAASLVGTKLNGTDPARYITPHERIKTVEVTLPQGFIANPEATPKCNPVDFAEQGSTIDSTGCPANTQVGYLNVSITAGSDNYGNSGFNLANEIGAHTAIYNLEPPKGVPADLGFNSGGFVQGHIYGIPDPAQNYAIKTVTPNITSLVAPRGTEVTVWGVPGDPAHDKFRYFPEIQDKKDAFGRRDVSGAPFGGAPIRPFFINPTDCGFDNGGSRLRLESYQHAGEFTSVQEYDEPLDVEGCEDPRFRFEPDVSLQPTSRHAGGPTGLDVHLEVPQRNDIAKDADELYAQNGFVKGISTPPIKRAVVTFPEGMTLSPSAAQGLGNCSPEQIGLGTDDPVSCPDSSQYGTLTLHTPLFPVDAQPEGWIYIAKQNDNPFHNFLSLYLVIQEPQRGILIKIPGRVDLDPDTGQIQTTFDDLPQFPVSDMQLTFKGGVRAALVNPTTCGKKTIRAEFFPWHEPQTPRVVNSSYEVIEKADGSPCVNDLAERPFEPQLDAGTLNNTAGAFSPFAFHLTRTDDDQEFSQLGVALPPGLVAKIAGVSECPEAGIVQAIGRTAAGDGSLEQTSPSCPVSSYIGSTDVGAGVGVPLTYVPGKIYLAGPYQGAPLSMVVITPALVGPYDLGVIAVRSALHVDPQTTQVSVRTDPFPQIFQGIPVRIRDIRVRTDRPDFTLNPTNCTEKQITAHVTGTGGVLASTTDDTAVDLADRFQAVDCASLEFKPKLSFRLFGGTNRGAHPKFRAVLRARPGDANIGRASVALPRSEFLDQSHIRTVCTRVQFSADRCPPGSVYGFARATSPLLDEPLRGPVYLRSSSNELPDLVAALRGRIAVDVVGRIDSVRGGIRNTFDVVPDAPVDTFTLTMQGGRKGLLINSRNLCASVARVTAKFTAQNGRKATLRPALQNSCKKSRTKNSK